MGFTIGVTNTVSLFGFFGDLDRITRNQFVTNVIRNIHETRDH